jgi:hypothetical protein
LLLGIIIIPERFLYEITYILMEDTKLKITLRLNACLSLFL